MRKVIYAILASVYSTAAFAGAGSENVVKCRDQKDRVVIVERITGATGGAPGSYLAEFPIPGKFTIPIFVKKEHFDSTHPILFKAPGILISVDTVHFMDLPAGQVRGSLKLKGDRKAAPMICNEGPAYLK